MFAPVVHVDRADLSSLWEVMVRANRRWVRRVGPANALRTLLRVRWADESVDTYYRIWEITQSGQGDCEDLVFAWVAVLRELGVNAWPLFIAQRGGQDHVVMSVAGYVSPWDVSRWFHGMP